MNSFSCVWVWVRVQFFGIEFSYRPGPGLGSSSDLNSVFLVRSFGSNHNLNLKSWTAIEFSYSPGSGLGSSSDSNSIYLVRSFGSNHNPNLKSWTASRTEIRTTNPNLVPQPCLQNEHRGIRNRNRNKPIKFNTWRKRKSKFTPEKIYLVWHPVLENVRFTAFQIGNLIYTCWIFAYTKRRKCTSRYWVSEIICRSVSNKSFKRVFRSKINLCGKKNYTYIKSF